MKSFDILLNESLESYECFYSLLFHQLQSFHQENIELKSNYYSEQIKSFSFLSQVTQLQETNHFLINLIKTSQFNYDELQFQYQNLQEISVGNYHSETMNSLLDEISELKEIKLQKELEIFDLKQKNIQLENDFMNSQRKCDLLESERISLRNELNGIHSKYRNEAYENFMKLYEIIQKEAIDVMSHLPEVTIRPAGGSAGGSAGGGSATVVPTEILTIPSITSPAHLLLHDPTLSSSHLSSSHGLLLYTSPSAPLPQQIYHQIVNFPLNGALFESFTALLFQCHGYRPTLRSHSYDNGIDIDLTYSDPTRTWRGVVQCKQYTYKLGSGIIREFIGSMLNDNCHSGFLVTTSYFTREANKTAEIWRQKGNHLELWDAKILLEKITPHAEYLLNEINAMRRQERSSNEVTGVGGGVDLCVCCDYLKIQESVEMESEFVEDSCVCVTRGDRAFSILSDDHDTSNQSNAGVEERTQVETISNGSRNNCGGDDEEGISVYFADLSVSPLRQSPLLDENSMCHSNTITSPSSSSLPCSLPSFSPPRQSPHSKPYLPHSLSHLSRPPQSRSPTAPPITKAPHTPTPRATSPKRTFRSPFMNNDKVFPWTLEETHALSLLVAKFSQNSASQRVNWGQMESWLKLPEGIRDPVGSLIREEHKDKEKLRSKWKNEGRSNPTAKLVGRGTPHPSR
jgi:HJR/Mrr/RecB family endonuclease